MTDLLEFSGEAVVIYDSDFRFLYVNAEAERQIGMPRADLVGNAVWRLFPDTVAPYWDTLVRARDERTVIAFESRSTDGNSWVKGRCVPAEYHGDKNCLAVFYGDVTYRHDLDRARVAEREALSILTCVNDAFMALDPYGYVIFANPQADLLVEAGEDSLFGQNIWEKWPSLRGTLIESEYERVRRTQEPADFEYGFPKSGRWLDIRIFPAPQREMYVVFREITERKAMEAEQKRLLAEAVERADRDPLTGLLNHRAFYERLHAEIVQTDRHGGRLALVLLDVDHFKFFNEAFGHLVGDDVLKQIAATLRSCCREADVLGRLGGDEFAIMITGSAEQDARKVVERVQACIRRQAFIPPDSATDIPLGCSLGMVSYPDEAASAREMVSLADQRLARAKRSDVREDTDRFFDGLRQNKEGFSLLDALVTAVDNKDRYTRKHSEDVYGLVQRIADQLNLSGADRETLRIAALLHDVGKIGVPDRILRRPSPLSAADYGAIKQHPTMGAAIIGAVPGMEQTLPAVRHHHEAWDGSGYPDGLRGEMIPLPARILAVADAYSAMTTDRPYRKGLSGALAREILLQGEGSQWDPAIVQAFLSVTNPTSVF
jgi:diguanylate cyclase (GGDEF)-like protein/PAS domain S-box-containing protein